jgi:dTDP-glucose 4,6-dehydratase
MKRIIVTGGCGFMGHHFIEHVMKNTDWEVIVFDKLSYASSGYDRLRDINVYDDKRIKIFAIDLSIPIQYGVLKEVGSNIDYIFHFAANSHVDRSIEEPVQFVKENVMATLNILEFARIIKPEMVVNFSTDEVFGPAPSGKFFTEFEYHFPSNPYAASKSAQESIGIAYMNTYGVPVITTHTMNLIGERQDPEKFLPLLIRKIYGGETVIIHSDKTKTISGSRCYIHCRNVASALLHIVEKGYDGYDEWNIAGEKEVSNLELAQTVAGILEKPLLYEMVDFHSSRPGHDLRYALDSTKLLTSGYSYPKNFEETVEKVVRWYFDGSERLEKWLGMQ